MLQCGACRAAVASPPITEEQVAAYYVETYFSGDAVDHHKGDTLASDYLEKARPVLDDLGKEDAVLEVGAGFGYFSSLLAEQGYGHITVCEPSVACTEFIREKSPGIELVRDIDALIATGRKFRAIFAFHVMEHVTDPQEFLSKLRSLCADDGCLMILTPNGASAAFLKYKRDWVWACPEQHLNFLSEEIPPAFYRSLGFETLIRKSVTPHEVHYPSRIMSRVRKMLRALHPHHSSNRYNPRWLLVGVAKYALHTIGDQFECNVPDRKGRALEAHINSLAADTGKDELFLVLRAK